ncbi:MAG: ABC transporter ATP-binding protein [Clostridia bacterium]|uniref:ABC transporter ATP-binding protein n=1 Tax=Pumilibacter muris TaxID=2941510 RepID=UPI00203D9C25|nr:ABC transporter ATP-binding protein [Pumilibacter muris]MCI8596582.1 ABC transporter ATP-binding protein [Clostridia bacterium]
MLKLFKYLRKRDWLLVALSVGLVVLQVWLELTMPDYTKEITELVVTPGGTLKKIWLAGGKMLACALGSMVSAVIVGFFASKISASFAMNLRSAIFDKVESFSMEEINRFSTASLITRSTNDVTQVQMVLVLGLQVMIKAPIMAVWAIIKIAGKQWQWSTVVAAAVGILVLMILVVVLFAVPKFRKIQTLTDNLNRVTRENLTGVRVVRAYNAELYQEEKFAKANDELTNNYLFSTRVMALMSPGMSIIMNGMSLAIYWIGAVLIKNASVIERVDLFGNMTSFMSYGMQVVMAFMLLTMIFIMMPRAFVSARRINEVLHVEPSITDPAQPKLPNGNIVGEVEFKNVSFKYPDAEEYVIENVSFKANKGDTVAFIGSTGSGKSTLINLVPRFYDVTEGEVLVDGQNVKDYSLTELHRKLGYVPQRGVLFSGTVENNVNYGHGEEERTVEDVKRAVEIAQGKDFVEKMEGQYTAPVAQGGTNVSGGQKQRLSIARAVIRNPEIFIFDDSFSALDYKTDRVLRSALKKETGDATRLIVAQRIGTILDADKILVLDEGKVVGQGTHSELMESCEVYRQIAYSQLSKEEL